MATSNSRGSEFDTSSIHVYETAEGFGTFGDIYQQMLTDNLVNVVNISYGLNEDYVNGFDRVRAYIERMESVSGAEGSGDGDEKTIRRQPAGRGLRRNAPDARCRAHLRHV